MGWGKLGMERRVVFKTVVAVQTRRAAAMARQGLHSMSQPMAMGWRPFLGTEHYSAGGVSVYRVSRGRKKKPGNSQEPKRPGCPSSILVVGCTDIEIGHATAGRGPVVLLANSAWLAAMINQPIDVNPASSACMRSWWQIVFAVLTVYISLFSGCVHLETALSSP